MSRLVYSTHFYSAQGLSGAGTTITVPANHVYVVKQLTFYSDPTLGTCRGFFRDLGSGATLFAGAAKIVTPTWEGFFGTLVFEPGEQFRWEVSAFPTDGADVSISGFDLTQ